MKQKLFFYTLLSVSIFLLEACQGNIKKETNALSNSVEIENTISAPNWYSDQKVFKEGYYVGYGEGESLGSAKTQARSDLSKQLKTTVQTYTQRSVSQNNSDIGIVSSSKVSEISEAELSDLEVIKSQQQNKKYYVALGMDFRPLVQRVQTKFANLDRQTKSNFLKTTSLFKSLKEELGFFPNINLIGDGKAYFLKNGEQLLKVFQKEIPEIYPLISSNNIHFEIKSPRVPLTSGSLYHVNFYPKISGFLTYIQVFQSGDTALFFENMRVLKQQKLTYPDLLQYDGLVAELKPEQIRAQDLHLAILCPDPRPFNQLEKISSKSNLTYTKNLHKLFTLIENCHVVTEIIEIRR